MELKVLGFSVVWFLLLSTGVVVGCYYWYKSTEDTTSRVFSIIVPIAVIGMFGYGAINPDAAEGGRKKRR